MVYGIKVAGIQIAFTLYETMYETCDQDNTEILNCVRGKLLICVREKFLSCLREKLLSCVRAKLSSCVRKKFLSSVRKKLSFVRRKIF